MDLAFLTLVHVSFFSWLTSFGGLLSDEQIESYYALMTNGETKPSPERLARLRTFMEEDTDDDFVMLNFIDLYEMPLQIEGERVGISNTHGASFAVSGRERRKKETEVLERGLGSVGGCPQSAGSGPLPLSH